MCTWWGCCVYLLESVCVSGGVVVFICWNLYVYLFIRLLFQYGTKRFPKPRPASPLLRYPSMQREESCLATNLLPLLLLFFCFSFFLGFFLIIRSRGTDGLCDYCISQRVAVCVATVHSFGIESHASFSIKGDHSRE